MAGNRRERFTPLFQRLSGLLKAGVIRFNDRPVWYDVYKAFPPAVEPNYRRPKPQETVRSILYPEDIPRAQYFKTFDDPGKFNLFRIHNKTTTVHKFMNKWLKQHGNAVVSKDVERLMKPIVEELKMTGVDLKTKYEVAQAVQVDNIKRTHE